MKKYILFFSAIFVIQTFYVLRLRSDINTYKNITQNHILEIFDRTTSYTSYNEENILNNKGLEEPSNMNISTDIIERIDILDQHLSYNPSITWIKNVCDHAKKEINLLRERLSDDSHSKSFSKNKNNVVLGNCTFN